MLQLEQVYVSDYMNVATDKQKSYIEIAWLKQPSSEIYRKEVKWVTNLVAQEKITRALYDSRGRSYIEIGDQNWFIQEIIPTFSGNNLRLAFCLNPITLSTMDFYRVEDAISADADLKKRIQFETFLTREEAHSWLFQ
ncbi:MAG: hypothetical protein M3142_06465 [Bacteroidota bacterium]|nr:hypothetical protein [Bacteroidota bacterium]